MEYAFTFRFLLSQADHDIEALVERLGEAGCDDTLVGTGLLGRVALSFVREADSAKAAMVSALSDARRAMPSATLIEAVPDLVGLTDIADAVGMSRQNMRKLMIGYPESFPAPVHEGSTTLWHLLDVLVWLDQRDYSIDPILLDVAATAMQVNFARCASQVGAGVAGAGGVGATRHPRVRAAHASNAASLIPEVPESACCPGRSRRRTPEWSFPQSSAMAVAVPG
ncbi:hypothetical protein LMG26411_04288 [Cupriavidus numazuensis]|uniref:DNA-binding protein n=1 Tax=Cupriavidus numazuensis TaxID=221992 RepID=A0ABN7Q7L4_9BURK|nr:hypothetical protein LMG26411_04288 [Cupriavidus numazuensis]